MSRAKRRQRRARAARRELATALEQTFAYAFAWMDVDTGRTTPAFSWSKDRLGYYRPENELIGQAVAALRNR